MGDDLGHRLRTRLLTLLLRGLSATWRFRETIPPECAPILEGRARGVVAFWHGKMLPVWYRFRGPRTGALVSMSRDGALLADYLERGLRYGRVIRGSSSRSGGEALREMVALLGERSCLITPDGPRGPLHRSKPGAMIAAARAGVPVVLAGWECARVTVLRSWDRMEIPHPFARIDIRYCMFDAAAADDERETRSGEGVPDAAVRRMNPRMDAAEVTDAGTMDAGTMDADVTDVNVGIADGSIADADASVDGTAGAGMAGRGVNAADAANDAGDVDDGTSAGVGHLAVNDAAVSDDTVNPAGIAHDAGAVPDAGSASGAAGLRDEPSQFDVVRDDTFAGSRASWIGPEVLERFDCALDALNAPDGIAAGARRESASSRGSRKT